MAVRGAPAVIEEDLVGRFERELEWRDALDAKAQIFLGFAGATLSVQFTLLTVGGGGVGENRDLVAAPALLLTLAVGMLLLVLYGYSVAAGPTPITLLRARGTSADDLRTSLAVAYGYSLLSNRLQYARSRAAFELAVLLVGVAIFRLGVSVMVVGLDPTRTGLVWTMSTPAWLPAPVGTLVSAPMVRRRERSAVMPLEGDLNSWNVEVEGE